MILKFGEAEQAGLPKNWQGLPTKDLKDRYTKAKEVYYLDPNGEQIMTDAEFDRLEDYLKNKVPKWKGFSAGTPIKVKKTKVKLPVPMFSLDKVKPETVEGWVEHHDNEEVVTSDKLDGSALEVEYVEGVPVGAYTRGNGIIGGNVSYLIPHLKIPQRVGKASFIVRCEGLFSAAAFSKHKNDFDAARNAASGILNRTDIHPAVRDMSVVVLQVLRPNEKPSKALAWAKSKGFTVVPFKVFRANELTRDKLSKLLKARRAKSQYKLDGIVLTLNKVNQLPRQGNPSWAVAFKENVDVQQLPIATVREVIWEVSPHGYLKPTALYSPIKWEDATLERATAFNARFVETHSIGPGAKIKIVRSGDIIPKIEAVVKPAAKPQMPDPKKHGDFTWSKNRVDLILANPKDNEDFRVRRITRFMTEVGVDFMKEGNVRKMYDAGFTNLSKIMRATPKDFLAIPGVKEQTATKLFNAIHFILDKGIPIIKLMDASGTFPRGMGSKRFQQIHDQWGMKKVLKIAGADPERLRKALMKLPGWKDTTVDAFMKGAPVFSKWLKVTGLNPTYAKDKEPEAKTQKLAGMFFTWTGYRNGEEEELVRENGGQIVSFGSKTTHLLYRPGGKQSSKVDKAKSKGIKVITWDQLAKVYKL